MDLWKKNREAELGQAALLFQHSPGSQLLQFIPKNMDTPGSGTRCSGDEVGIGHSLDSTALENFSILNNSGIHAKSSSRPKIGFSTLTTIPNPKIISRSSFQTFATLTVEAESPRWLLLEVTGVGEFPDFRNYHH